MSETEGAMTAPATTTTAESEGATTDEDAHLSPTSVWSGGGGGRGDRIKILCSFGGRIVPRPSDGALKYVGGETRVLSIPRSTPFSEMKKKVEEMFKTEVAAIKYQLVSVAEDLDVLVSVTCDEDLVHMLDEYDRFEMKRSPTASPRFRFYVFAPQPPAARPAAAAAPSSSRLAGYTRPHPQHHHHHHHRHYQPERFVATVPATPNGSPPFPSPSPGAVSAGNSPRAHSMGAEQQPVFGLGGMQRVRSTPNLGALVDAAPLHSHPHAPDVGAGYGSSSPSHPGAGALFTHTSFHHHHQHQYPPAPVPVAVPHHAGAPGRYDARGYVLVGNYLAPMVPAPARQPERPGTRGGPVPHGELQAPKKAALVWD